MDAIKLNDEGAAVEDVQQRLCVVGILDSSQITGVYNEETAQAVKRFCGISHLAPSLEVTEEVWKALVDASYNLGDRSLYLRVPYFRGHDVGELQQVLGALGFYSGKIDGIFGAHTELALRNLQTNLGLPSEGIAGAYTYAALRNLHHSWEGKEASHITRPMGFARAAHVLESNAICLFGTDEFSRSVASRMSNVAQATNPTSKIVSADSLSVKPDDSMILVHVATSVESVAGRSDTTPLVTFADESTLAVRLRSALDAARATHPARIVVVLPGETWEDAGADRSAQHYAITLLDAICAALG